MPSNKADNNGTNQNGTETSTSKGEAGTLKHQNKRYAQGYVMVPNWVIREVPISRDAKLLYGILQSYAWLSDNAFPGYETLMADMQCGREALAKYIKELKDAGLIEVKRRGQGYTNIYTIVDWTHEGFLQHQAEVKKSQNRARSTSNRTSRSTEKPNDKKYIKPNANNMKSKDEKGNKTKNLSKGQSPIAQKGMREVSPDARIHIARGTIRKQRETKENERAVSKGEASNGAVSPTLTVPPLTQDEINEKKAQGRNASGFQHIGVSLEHMHILKRQFGNASGSPPETQQSRQQGHWKKAPLFIQGTIGDWFSLEMHDQAINSTITRCDRLYQRWKQRYPDAPPEDLQDGFYALMQEARTKSKRATIKTWTPNGQPNRTPFFLACLEELCGFREPPRWAD